MGATMAKLWLNLQCNGDERKVSFISLSLPDDGCFYGSCLPMRPFKREFNTTPLVVNKLYRNLHTNYETSRQKCEEEWPPAQPSSIVNLALIHYQNRRTQGELIEISTRCKEGASHIDKLLIASNSNVTTDIHKIFMPECGKKPPKRILIEGAPGIGKTMLTREIAYQWANGEILQEYKLVFLLYLRNPKLHEVNSINEILKLFSHENIHDLKKYVTEFENNVAFVFDGFDEYPIALQEESFITDLIKGNNDGIMFLHSLVVVTSRPTATLSLHGIVDRRIEILGFPKEEREKYISLSLGNSLDKIQELSKYLKQHPIIDNLCFIPLHLAILMYLFQQQSLPDTLTEMNELFIINTVYRYLERNKLSRPSIVKELQDFPTNIFTFIKKLSRLAFKGLQNNQLVFGLDEIKEICGEVGKIPGAINGFGLLQAVQHYPKRGAGKTTSVNFLHFTMQEYLGAFYVSTLPSGHQSWLIKKKFWDGQFSFMWMMYVGIVGVKSNAFASFIGTGYHLNDDKRKLLHLFQCYMEAKSDAEMPKAVSSVFTSGKIILNGITLLPHHISSLIFFMSASLQQWKILGLGNCSLRDIGMNSLLEHVIKNSEKLSTLECVDLSGNGSSPWGVHCAIIRHCCVNSLTLYGDEGMKEYVENITDSLQKNLTLKSLTLCKIGKIGIQLIESILVNNTTLKELNLSWGSNANGIKIIERPLKPALHNNNVVYVNILYDDYHEGLSKTIDLSKKNIDDDGVYVIAFGLCYNNTVDKLDLSHNKITINGMIKLSECVKYAESLEYVDLSGNSSSPWGEYCAIITHCCVKSLTLCGDKGMKEYVKDIMDSLQRNSMLETLTLCKIGSTGVQSIEKISLDNTTLMEINLSWGGNCNGTKIITRQLTPALYNNNGVYVNILYDNCHEYSSNVVNLSQRNIDDDAAYVIAFGLYNNTSVKKLDLSHNNISAAGMNKLSECVKHTISLEYVDLSRNKSSQWTVYCAIIRHCCVSSLALFGDEGMKEYVKDITDSIQRNSKLESLTINKIRKVGMWSIKRISVDNATLQELNLSWGNNANGTIIMKRQLKPASHNNNGVFVNILCDDYHECFSKGINLSGKNIDDNVVYVIAFGLYKNITVEKLNLSQNNITVNGMNKLLQCVKQAVSLEYVDLSGNKSSPWGVYCAIIRHCRVNNLVLCGDDGMIDYIEEATHSLKQSTTLHSLTLCASRNNVVRYEDMVIRASNTKTPQGISVIVNKINFSTLVSEEVTDNRVVNVKILYDSDGECSPETISMSNSHVNDDTVSLITLGLYNNTTIMNLDLSCNNITDNGAVIISDYLKYNNTLLKLDISHNKITNDGAVAISNYLKQNKTVKELNLSYNLMSFEGIITLSESIKYVECVDLSENESSSWGGYCEIIRHCCVKKLTLCGDKGMKKYAKELTDNLQINTMLQSLTLCASSNVRKHEDMFVKAKSTKLPQNILVINGTLYFSALVNVDEEVTNNRVVNVSAKIFYDDDVECLTEAISLSNRNINDDTVCLITLGLYNNTTIKKLDLSCNNITDNGAVIISDYLKHNTTLEKLDISHNRITDDGAVAFSGSLTHNNTLQKLDISHNNITDKGAVAISDCLKHNNTLLTLDISYNKNGAVAISYSLHHNNTLQKLDISHSEITDNGVMAISESLKYNNSLQKLDVSRNEITDDGAVAISECLKHNNSLQKLDVSHNEITDDGAVAISECLKHNNSLQKLDVSHNEITDNGAVAISDCLRHNKTIKELNLSQNLINFRGINICIKYAEYVDFSGNKSSPWGEYCAIIRHCCVCKLTLCGDQGMIKYFKQVTDGLRTNKTLQSLTLHSSRRNGGGYKDMVVKAKSTKRQENVLIIDGKLYFTTLVNDNEEVTDKRAVDIKIIYDSDGKCLPETVTLSNVNVNDDTVCLIMLGLYNNTTVKKLDLSCNCITDNGAVIISDCLKHNNTLQQLDISHNNITDNGITTISDCLKYSTIKKLNLSQNNIHIRGMSNLSEYIRCTKSLEYIDLSGNRSSPWGVYCVIIRHYYVNSLTLCGDKGMKEYVKEITESLQTNVSLQSLTLCKIGRIGLQSIKDVLGSNTTLKELNMSWTSIGINTTRLVSGSYKETVDINILYDGDHDCSSEVVDMSNKAINNDAAFLLIFGLHYNTTVQKLDLSCNNLTNDGAVEISKYLKYNHALRELNLSRNSVSFIGMNNLSKCIKSAIPLAYIDLSGNKSTPWGVYCAIIRHCCSSHLTFCGDKGMEDYIKEITDSLEANATLQSLTLCKIHKCGLQSIKDVLGKNTILKELNVSWMSKGTKIIHRKILHSIEAVVNINILYDGDHDCSSEVINMSNKGIDDDAVHLISFGLYNNTVIQILDLSCNNITDDGVGAISDCCRSIYSLRVLILSKNSISFKGAKKISDMIRVNKVIWKLDISHNQIHGIGTMAISESLKTNNTLQELNLSDNQITSEGVKKIAEAICVNKGLHKLDVSQNAVSDDGVMHISDSLKSNKTLLELNLSKSEINNVGGIVIAEAIQMNTALQKLDLSQNNISDNEVIIISRFLKGNNTLKELNLSNTNVSEEGLKIIAQAIQLRNTSLQKLDLSHILIHNRL